GSVHRRGDPGVLPGPNGELQGAECRRVPGPAAEERDGENPPAVALRTERAMWPRALGRLVGRIRRWHVDRREPAAVERRRDRRGVPASDPGIDRAVDEGIGWLGRAQDETASRDDGVAAWFSLRSGWSASYP